MHLAPRRRRASVPTLREMIAADNQRRALARKAAALKSVATTLWASGHPSASDAFALVAARLDTERLRL